MKVTLRKINSVVKCPTVDKKMYLGKPSVEKSEMIEFMESTPTTHSTILLVVASLMF